MAEALARQSGRTEAISYFGEAFPLGLKFGRDERGSYSGARHCGGVALGRQERAGNRSACRDLARRLVAVRGPNMTVSSV